LDAGRSAIEALVEESENALDTVVEYADALDGWLSNPENEEIDQELGRRLADQHATIQRLVESAKGQTATALKGLRERGRGFMAYTDIFPKRISTMRPKKG
jgi:hypothetical protein